MRPSRELDPVEVRVLGALLEKEQSTPASYPLSLNALVSACNQTTNREPVMHLEEADVAATLDRLREEVLVWPVQGARVDRWRHALDRRWELEDGRRKALMTLLLLRGPQTPGELRSRSERLHPFGSSQEVEATLSELAAGAEPLVTVLPRAPGQKEARWVQLVGGVPADSEAPAPQAAPFRPSLGDRVAELEARVSRLEVLLGRDEDTAD